MNEHCYHSNSHLGGKVLTSMGEPRGTVVAQSVVAQSLKQVDAILA
jgi:hypothetical protein